MATRVLAGLEENLRFLILEVRKLVVETRGLLANAEPGVAPRWPSWEEAPPRDAVTPGPWIAWRPTETGQGRHRDTLRADLLGELAPHLACPDGVPSLLDPERGAWLDLTRPAGRVEVHGEELAVSETLECVGRARP